VTRRRSLASFEGTVYLFPVDVVLWGCISHLKGKTDEPSQVLEIGLNMGLFSGEMQVLQPPLQEGTCRMNWQPGLSKPYLKVSSPERMFSQGNVLQGDRQSWQCPGQVCVHRGL
jgi:hypothetical protein